MAHIEEIKLKFNTEELEHVIKHAHQRFRKTLFCVAFFVFLTLFALALWLGCLESRMHRAKHREGVTIDKCDRLNKRIEALESQLQKPSPVCFVPCGPIQPRVIVASRHGRRHRRYRG